MDWLTQVLILDLLDLELFQTSYQLTRDDHQVKQDDRLKQDDQLQTR